MNQRIEIDKESNKVLIKGWEQILNFYYAPIGTVGFAILGLVMSFPDITLPVLFLSMALLFYFLQRRLLKMREFRVSCSMEQLQQAFFRTAKIREWEIEFNNEKSLQAFDQSVLFGYFGDLIIVSKTDVGFLINTLPDPRKTVEPFFTPHKKSNAKEFINQLQGVLKGKFNTLPIESMQSEWTIKKVLIRLIAYPFCFLLIYAGLTLIQEPINEKSIAACIGVIIAAFVYLFFDIKAIINKQKNKT